MKCVALFCIVVGVSAWSTAVRAESVPLKPGEYQIAAVTEASNGEAGKPDIHTRCVKDEHLANPDAVFNNYVTNGFKLKPSNKVMNVSVHDGKVSYESRDPSVHPCRGHRIRYHVLCGPQGKTHLWGRPVGHDENRRETHRGVREQVVNARMWRGCRRISHA